MKKRLEILKESDMKLKELEDFSKEQEETLNDLETENQELSNKNQELNENKIRLESEINSLEKEMKSYKDKENIFENQNKEFYRLQAINEIFEEKEKSYKEIIAELKQENKNTENRINALLENLIQNSQQNILQDNETKPKKRSRDILGWKRIFFLVKICNIFVSINKIKKIRIKKKMSKLNYYTLKHKNKLSLNPIEKLLQGNK